MGDISIDQHNIEIQKNLKSWENKPILREVYKDFYRKIGTCINRSVDGHIVELGSGIGNIKSEIPQALCTDIFKNPWIDQVENAYQLSFEKNTVSNIILFDVFHHIEYPGNALNEFYRVLRPGGRVIIFDPSMSLFGLIVYGILHHEPVALMKKINWSAPEDLSILSSNYYAAQGNVERIFFKKKFRQKLNDWEIVNTQKYSALAYVLSGGYSKPQLFPTNIYNFIKKIEKILDVFPALFGTRSLVVLQK